MSTTILIHADGACSGNPGPGGWAATVKIDDTGSAGSTVLLTGGAPGTTNNIMELTAASAAMRHVIDTNPGLRGAEITLRLDAEYVLKGLGEWMPGWKRRGWRNAKNEPVANRSLWEEADALHERLKSLGTVKLVYVRGHSKDPENDLVDERAVAARERSRLEHAAWTAPVEDLSHPAPGLAENHVEAAARFRSEAEALGFRVFDDPLRRSDPTHLFSLQTKIGDGNDTIRYFVTIECSDLSRLHSAGGFRATVRNQFFTGDNLEGTAINVSFEVEDPQQALDMTERMWSRMGFGCYRTPEPEEAPVP
ncbi:ribonuclease HI [Cereibacter sphaeroides]|uniref:ribonuclease H family protein n=1 Tax=Cereibacter sphaeroides TaxID=1063 RepID=UPI001F3133A3|nr:ribonuclease H [Cereibacter sphaeroides]MCE6958757.1 ribonuclease HI [Cereibacter sphaeroides]MCE6973369.1 ribonuclease HI [Cereibacter sphaeroides]